LSTSTDEENFLAADSTHIYLQNIEKGNELFPHVLVEDSVDEEE